VKEPGFRWLTGHNPQDEIKRLTTENGHRMGEWMYVGNLRTAGDLWRHEGCACIVCGAPACYGRQQKPDGRTALALWGAALAEECPAQMGAREASR
jgi:hypothetical protein